MDVLTPPVHMMCRVTPEAACFDHIHDEVFESTARFLQFSGLL
jgi:hypothetical protein